MKLSSPHKELMSQMLLRHSPAPLSAMGPPSQQMLRLQLLHSKALQVRVQCVIAFARYTKLCFPQTGLSDVIALGSFVPQKSNMMYVEHQQLCIVC